MKGIPTSGRIWIYLLIESVCSVILFYQINVDTTMFTAPERYCHLVYCPFLLGTFLASCYADSDDFSSNGGRYQPMEFDSQTEGVNSNSEYHCSFLSFITFSYLNPIIKKGAKQALVVDDMPEILLEFDSKERSDEFLTIFNRGRFVMKDDQSENEYTLLRSSENLVFQPNARRSHGPWKGSVFWSVAKQIGCYFLVSFAPKFVYEISDLVFPFFLKLLMQFVADPSQPLWHGLLLAMILLLVTSVQSLTLHYYLYRIFFLTTRLRSSLMPSIYRKSFRLNNSSMKGSSIGEMVNLMSVDTDQVIRAFQYFDDFLSCPLKLVIVAYLLYLELGNSVLFGMLAIVALFPLNYLAFRNSQKYQDEQLAKKDERVKLITEILNGIKIIKFYAWEKSFMEAVSRIRQLEIKALRLFLCWELFIVILWNLAPTLLSLITFAAYVTVYEQVLTAEKIFVSLALFNLLQYPLNVLPSVFTYSISVSEPSLVEIIETI